VTDVKSEITTLTREVQEGKHPKLTMVRTRSGSLAFTLANHTPGMVPFNKLIAGTVRESKLFSK
jgi:hypothetical protein